jgi:phosphomannomutase
MSDTPETDAETTLMTLDCDDSCVEIYIKRDGKVVEGEFILADFARRLERERDEARAALSGRTVSCSNCNELARENAEMKMTLRLIYESQQRILALSDKLLEQNLK